MHRTDYVSLFAPKKNRGTAPIFPTAEWIALWIEQAQLERLADRLRAVHHVQLAQDLLHVVLHRERADLEDRADLEVRLAQIDPLQYVELAHREDAAAGGLVAAVLGALGELGAHPRRVQRRGEELHEVCLALAGGDGVGGEGEEADRAAVEIMDPVPKQVGGAEPLALALEAARADLAGGAEV